MPPLEKLMEWVKTGKLRNNISQFSGWLILIGAMEYGGIPEHKRETVGKAGEFQYTNGDLYSIQEPITWKVGAFEPTTEIHGDIEFLYTVDLEKQTITFKKV